MMDAPFNAPQILDATGKPARKARGTEVICPGCGATCPPGDTSKRQLSGGFGVVTDLCSTCGHDFGELTLPLLGK